jgi:hypothetical protein
MNMLITVTKHAFWLTSLVLAFYLSGMIGLLCEAQDADLAISSSIFSVSFASFTAFFFKIYMVFFADLFG